VKARLGIAASFLAGAAVMAWVTVRAGADLTAVLGLLPAHAHLLALVATVADYLGRAARISLLARGVGHRVRFSTALAASLAGEGAGAVTPSKAGAPAAKIALFTRDRMDVGTGGAVLVGETLSEAFALLPLGLLAVLFLPGGRTGAYAALGFAVLVAVATVALYWVARLPLRDAPGWWTRLGLGERRWRVVRVVARRFRHRSRALEHLRPGILAGVGVATVIHLAGRLAVLPALAVGHVHGQDVAELVGWPFILLYGGSLVPTPAGGGAIEAAFAATLTSVLGSGHVGGMLVWWRVYTFYAPALLGGAILLIGGALFRHPSPSSAP
jgi:uncharacterized membrane protein YbhN (UPF0104 family)